MITTQTTPERRKQGLLRDTFFISPATGISYFIDADGKAVPAKQVEGEEFEEWFDEGPTCSICDGLGHGYPGGRPCPLEDSYDGDDFR